jgi:glycosyltransferase involved in cell wall biosynthesis
MILPSLSIIIPNYNHGQHLPMAVRAIVNQPVQPLEIIIIDDGSTDNSIEVIRELASNNPLIQFYKNEKNCGVSVTLNRGIDLSRGDYLFFPAADDEILPGFLEKSLNLLARYPQAGLSCTIGDWREVATGLNWHMGVGMAESPSYLSPQQMVELERKSRLYIPGHTTVMKRSALIEAGKFVVELKHCNDWFADYVVGFRQGICVVPEPLAVFNIYPDSYYKRNVRDQVAYREVLERMLKMLNQSDYRDASDLICQAGSLFIFGRPMLKLLLSQREYRRFITPTFLRKNLWHSTKLILKKFTPAFLGNLYFRLAGYRAKTPSLSDSKTSLGKA